MYMRLLVMSDTHGDANIIKRVCDRHEQVDAIIHCGDSELAFDHPYLEGVKRVRGNCDADQRFPNEELFTMDGVSIYVTHGHLYNVKSTTMNLYYRAKEVEAKVAFFGHSHQLGMELIDDILFVNPGSLLKPRGMKEKSYVIVEFDNNSWHIQAYSDQGKTLLERKWDEGTGSLSRE